MAILCLWEFTQHDSAAEVVLAVIIFFGMTAALVLAAFKVVQIARRSEQQHKTPAYMLYADATTLNKWGFLYVQYRASAYYYIIPTLLHILIKAMFVALGQGSGTTQAIALVLIEAAALIAASVMRPWMDKPANVINISICAVNFVNAILLMIFTGIFDGPGLLIGACGVIFFILNAIFALVLLIVVLIASAFPFMQKNPDTRYQPIADNRASFIKSQTALTTELDMLGYSARGEMKGGYKDLGLDDDNDNYLHPSDKSIPPHDVSPPRGSFQELPRSPISPSRPFIPGGSDSESFHSSHGGLPHPRAPSPYSESVSVSGYTVHGSERGPTEYRAQNDNSPWQRGAGYEH
ncbi:hypothetical protein B7463_g11658, partial [Scytalidium lignicola]